MFSLISHYHCYTLPFIFWSRIPNFSSYRNERDRFVLTRCRFELNWISLKVFRLKNRRFSQRNAVFHNFNNVSACSNTCKLLFHTHLAASVSKYLFLGDRTRHEKPNVLQSFSVLCVCVCDTMCMLSAYESRDFFRLRDRLLNVFLEHTTEDITRALANCKYECGYGCFGWIYLVWGSRTRIRTLTLAYKCRKTAEIHSTPFCQTARKIRLTKIKSIRIF